MLLRKARSVSVINRKFLVQPHKTNTLKLLECATSGIGKRPFSDKYCFIESSDAISKCNERYSGIVQIKDTTAKGQGLYADKMFQPNELVMSIRAKSTSDKQSSHSVQRDWKEHIDMELPAILINHCCDANVGILDNNKDAYDFLALREIKKGSELVWDYECSEYEISTPFRCTCGSSKCRGVLSGFKYNGDVIIKRYAPFYASYLKDEE